MLHLNKLKKNNSGQLIQTGERYIVKAPVDTTVENGMIIAELIDDECSVFIFR